MKKYSAEYFINKFENIPEDKWTIFDYKDNEKYCALGHCGYTDIIKTREGKDLVWVLSNLGCVASINDSSNRIYGFDETLPFKDLGNTPKERVINALVLVAIGLDKEL